MQVFYDTVKLSSYFFGSHSQGARFFPIGKQANIKGAFHADGSSRRIIITTNSFKSGDLNYYAGFDEESIYTHRYAVGTGEYRYLIDKNSWFYVFTDYGYAAYKSNNASFDHTYLGLGTGSLSETKTGVFNIAVCCGKANDQSFDLRQSKNSHWIYQRVLSLFAGRAASLPLSSKVRTGLKPLQKRLTLV